MLLILGMRDNACRERIAEALGRIEGVKDVNVSLVRARAVVAHTSACAPGELVLAVMNAGYVAVPDERANGLGGGA